MDFAKAKQAFSRARNKIAGYRLPGRLGATRLVETVEGFGVRLYRTVVVGINRDGSYTLNSGGWRSVTTRDRITTYAPVHMFSSNGDWFVTPNGLYAWSSRSRAPFIYRFVDGMRVDGRGRLIPTPGIKVEALTRKEFFAWERAERNRRARERRQALREREANQGRMPWEPAQVTG